MRSSSVEKIGLMTCLSVVIGSIIGAGIFVLPSTLAPLGPNAVIAWFISAAGALCLAYSLGRLVDAEGAGIYAYIDRAFGHHLAFVVAWAFWCGIWTTNAILAVATVSALSRAFPTFSNPAWTYGLAIAGVCILTVVNALGIRSAGRLQSLTVAIKVLPLIAVVAIFSGKLAGGAPLQPLAAVPITSGNIALAVTLTLFSLTGFENMTTPVAKVFNPGRTIPLAIMCGTVIVAILYLSSSTAVTLMLPVSHVVVSGAPYSDAIAGAWGEGAARLTALCIAVSAWGCLNAGTLAAGELVLAMAENGDLPRWLAWTRKNGTPVPAQVFCSALTIIVVLLNSSKNLAGIYTFVILLATVGTLTMYFFAALAALKKTPGLPRLIIVLGLGFALFAFWGSGAVALGWNVVLIAGGLAIRAIVRTLSSRSPIGSSPLAEANPAVLPE